MGRALLMLVMMLAACGQKSAPSPFVNGADAGVSDATSDAEVSPDGPLLGKPCVDDAQCDDGIDCTFDQCDAELGRCRAVADDSVCADSTFCDGQEVCDARIGCVEGEPVSCSDDLPCTIDRCIEDTKSCEYLARDADGDGDPPWNCGGGDCNDSEPLVSSLAQEICANDSDDDCDRERDETDCQTPQFDTCASALTVEATSSHTLSFAATSRDVSASCVPGEETWRDVVATLSIPAGPALDVDVIATSAAAEVALASATLCGDAVTELACAASYALPNGAGQVARLRLRALPPGKYPLYVYSKSAGEVTLKVAYLAASAKPENETCGTAQPLEPGEQIRATLADAAPDVPTACSAKTGDLVYSFELAEARDVNIFASSRDGLGEPVLSLRSAACQASKDEITCRNRQPAHLFARALPPGTYFLAVLATAPTEVDVLLEVQPPTEAPADESCVGAPPLSPNQSLNLSVAGHTDDVQVSCLVGAPDAAYSLELGESSDVLLVSRISEGDRVALSLMRPECGQAEDLLVCRSATISPLRARARAVPAGSYRAVVESSVGSAVTLTALVRPSRPATLVAFADNCGDAVSVPLQGGFFQGNTTNVTADYRASCDLGGQTSDATPDQILELTLPESRRVVLDMQGSTYDTLLDVRKGPECPGAEVVRGCTLGSPSQPGFLDLILDAGQYFIQVGGYAGSRGAWTLDVFVVDP